jgi:hypothetical protein
MDNGNEPAHFLDTRDHFRKVCKEPLHGMDGVATNDVIGKLGAAARKKLVWIIVILTRP